MTFVPRRVMVDDSSGNSPQRSLGAALGDLSASADSFQLRLDQLNSAIAQLEESTDRLCTQKAEESDSLTTLADNLSHQPQPDDTPSVTGVSAVADD